MSAVYLEHRVLVWMGLAHLICGGAALAWMGRPWPIRLTSGWLPLLWVVSSLLWLFWQYLRHPRRVRAILSAERVMGAILVLLLIEPLQITFQALKQSIGPVVGFPLDPWLSRADLLLHGTAPWRLYARLLPDWSWVAAIDVLYLCWGFAVIGFLFWASWSHVRPLRQRALVAFLLLAIGGATLGAWAGASAGPCYYEFVTPPTASNPYDELLARLDAVGSGQEELFARTMQRGLWDVQVRDQPATFSGVSAMPSLHVGNAVLLALIAWRRSKIAGVLMTGYAVVIQIGSVVLAWHYAIDGYVGAMLAVGSWIGAGMLLGQGRTLPSPRATAGGSRPRTPCAGPPRLNDARLGKAGRGVGDRPADPRIPEVELTTQVGSPG